MSLLVQKYGGTSVGSIERIGRVADIIQKAYEQKHSLVVVLSAMSGETDRLLGLANQISEQPDKLDVDILLSTGEQVTIALLSMALKARGIPAKAVTGWQVPITTDSSHSKARILSIEDIKLKRELSKGRVVIVAGFQGVDKHGNITTLGRGGSDTTAVALAAKLRADECQIYTDVDGVYTVDPRVVPSARKMPKVTFEEMLELASLGAKVLQIRAVEFAGKHGVPLRVLSSFVEGDGTLITFEDTKVEQPLLSGIAFNRDEAKISLDGVPAVPGTAAKILSPISDSGIEVDIIVQSLAEKRDRSNFAFTVHRRDFAEAMRITQKVAKELGVKQLSSDDKVAKVSLVGVGMRSHAGIASKMFTTLGREGINIQLISTSEIKVSVVIDEKYLELAVRSLHTEFNLHEEPK